MGKEIVALDCGGMDEGSGLWGKGYRKGIRI